MNALAATNPVIPVATLSWFVFTLKIKIKGTFTLLFYWRFLFSMSPP
ncbi:hypothetical protein PAAG_12694 [Paracoccidioides lutzii Pb01]|uniref:Uncharacterized protein n=1 Tax=Paracoccidioides lutzii (strain ATCC MYA-826 / Pb01) TaxID=502779 RepID=A0A0A2VIE2_PARBA|nr:hypothetical protein PAAG_12694 [Paracoccidioides lutzii Pb01]KGQ00654.1 hypothetical protein PAAG_12694 [Paracoccidioides lutzii Pb01]